MRTRLIAPPLATPRLAGRLVLGAILPLLLFASPTPAQDEAGGDEAELKGAKATQVDTRLRAAVDAAGLSRPSHRATRLVADLRVARPPIVVSASHRPGGWSRR